MVSRVQAPRLGGSGYNPGRGERSGFGRFAQVARGATYLGGIMERRERKALDTASMEAQAGLFDALTSYDNDEATQGLNPEEKAEHMTGLIEAARSSMAEVDEEASHSLAMTGFTWREKLISDDRKIWGERQEAEAMDASARLLDQSRGQLVDVASDLMDGSDPQAPARAAALAGVVKNNIALATAHLPPAVRDDVMREMSLQSSVATVGAWLSSADDPVEAYERLRSNRDEYELPDGTTFNLSGPMSGTQIEQAIKADISRRSSEYTLRQNQRAEILQRDMDEAKAELDMLKTGFYSGQMTEDQLNEIRNDPTTSAAVAQGIDEFVHEQGQRAMARERRAAYSAGRDFDQIVEVDRYYRGFNAAATLEEVNAQRRLVLEAPLDVGHKEKLLAAGRKREDDIAAAQAAGMEKEVASFTRYWAAWDSEAVADVQRPGSAISDRLDAVETNPALKAQMDAEINALKLAAENFLLDTGGKAMPFLEVVMPMALMQVRYDQLLISSTGVEGQGSKAARWRQFMEEMGSPEAMDAFRDADQSVAMSFLARAGLFDEEDMGLLVFTQDKRLDVSRTVLAFERRQRDAARTPGADENAFFEQQRRIGSFYGKAKGADAAWHAAKGVTKQRVSAEVRDLSARGVIGAGGASP